MLSATIKKLDKQPQQEVSILVLMECSPQQALGHILPSGWGSFNPCFNGMLSAT